MAGRRCIVRDPPRPDVVLDQLARHKVTKWITVPTVIKNVLEALRGMKAVPKIPALSSRYRHRRRSRRKCSMSSAKRFGIEMHNSIGSSEITYEWIANGPADFKPGSLGRPVFGCEVRARSIPRVARCARPTSAGEAWIRSRTACFYYWRKFDKSRETFVGEWARTGDNLRFDEDGLLLVLEPRERHVQGVGLWVSPIEIEAALADHRAVREAAVVGFADTDGLTKAKAYVVLRTGFEAGPRLVEELKALVRPLGGYKVPAVIEVHGRPAADDADEDRPEGAPGARLNQGPRQRSRACKLYGLLGFTGVGARCYHRVN